MLTLTVNTNQEAFDAVARQLATQKGQAFDENRGSCLYVTEDGRRCAIGGLMNATDDEIFEELDRRGLESDVYGLASEGQLDAGDISETLLSRLQFTHDASDNWQDDTFVGWAKLLQVADDYNLLTSGVPR
jgi:hypothetical protein